MFNGNVEENWRHFQLEFHVNIECQSANLAKRQKLLMLLTLAGPEAVEREKSFLYRPAVEAVEAHEGQPAIAAVPAVSIQFGGVKAEVHRAVLPQKECNHGETCFLIADVSNQGESFNALLLDLHIKVTSCEFGNVEDNMIHDRIITSITNSSVRKQLL